LGQKFLKKINWEEVEKSDEVNRKIIAGKIKG
jgi:hypothetical protein